jgi:hypothetical protein
MTGHVALTLHDRVLGPQVLFPPTFADRRTLGEDICGPQERHRRAVLYFLAFTRKVKKNVSKRILRRPQKLIDILNN